MEGSLHVTVRARVTEPLAAKSSATVVLGMGGGGGNGRVMEGGVEPAGSSNFSAAFSSVASAVQIGRAHV